MNKFINQIIFTLKSNLIIILQDFFKEKKSYLQIKFYIFQKMDTKKVNKQATAVDGIIEKLQKDQNDNKEGKVEGSMSQIPFGIHNSDKFDQIVNKPAETFANPYVGFVRKANEHGQTTAISSDKTPQEEHNPVGGGQPEGQTKMSKTPPPEPMATIESVQSMTGEENDNHNIPTEPSQSNEDCNFDFLKLDGDAEESLYFDMKKENEGRTDQRKQMGSAQDSQGTTKDSTGGGQTRQIMGKRKASAHSQYSKGSAGSKQQAQNQGAQIQSTVLNSIINKQGGGDRLKNLTSVLASRQNSKNNSASRRTAAGERKASGPKHGVNSPVNFQNQRLLRGRKNSGINSKKNNQNQQIGSQIGVITNLGGKRPPSQSSKNSGSSSNFPRPPTLKNKQNPLISLTSGGGMVRKQNSINDSLQQTISSANQQSLDSSHSYEGFGQNLVPDNDYLETMKMKMRGQLPTNSGTNQAFRQNLLQNMEKQDLNNDFDLENLVSPGSSNTSGQHQSEKSKNISNSSAYVQRAIKRKEVMNNQQYNTNSQSQQQKDRFLSQSMTSLPDPNPLQGDANISGSPSKQPKSLIKKLAHLMKDTKSSAIRNSKSGYQIPSQGQFQTLEEKNVSPFKSNSKITPIKKRPTPVRGASNGKGKSPGHLGQQKQRKGMVNSMKSSASKKDGLEAGDNTNFVIENNLNINFFDDHKKSSNDIICDQNLTDPGSGQVTLEGISGMVVMNQPSDSINFDIGGHLSLPTSEDEDVLLYDQSLNTTMSGEENLGLRTSTYPDSHQIQELGAGDLGKTIDLKTISIDSNDLDEKAKVPNQDLQLSSRLNKEREEEKARKIGFDSEIMSIMSSIKTRAGQIRSKFKIGEAQQTQSARNDDPLSNISVDINDINDDAQSRDTSQSNRSELEQTIIIGEMDEGNIFDDLNIGSPDKKQKQTAEDENIIKITRDDLQELVDNLKIKHRAEIDAIMIEQNAYKKIICGMITKLKGQQKTIEEQNLELIQMQKYQLQSKKYLEINSKQKSEVQFYQNEVDKLKIALIEYDRHMRDEVINKNELTIQQLETENAHLRKLLNIPDELFNVDPEDEKKREAEKKRNVLKSIDEKLKQAEKKIAKKQTAAEIYYQREQGFDPFELDQDDYDIYRMSKLRELEQMPKGMKEQLHGKIYNKIEERSYREEMRRQHEKDILEEFARVYGYDIRKHQPHYNNGEIDVECLQAYIAECRAKEEKMAREANEAKEKESLEKQKEELKKTVGRTSGTSSGSAAPKAPQPAPKKPLTLETDNLGGDQHTLSTSKSEKDLDSQIKSEKKDDLDDDDDEFERSDTPPMTKDDLARESSNSAQNLHRGGDEAKATEDHMQMTMSASMLGEMFSSKESLATSQNDHLRNEPDIGESPQRQKEESHDDQADGEQDQSQDRKDDCGFEQYASTKKPQQDRFVDDEVDQREEDEEEDDEGKESTDHNKIEMDIKNDAPEEESKTAADSFSDPYGSNNFDMTLKDGSGFAQMDLSKTLKSNANISSGLEKMESDKNNRYKEFDDMDEDEDEDERNEATMDDDEEDEFDSKASVVTEQSEPAEMTSSQDPDKNSSSGGGENNQENKNQARNRQADENYNGEDGDYISDSGSTRSNTQDN